MFFRSIYQCNISQYLPPVRDFKTAQIIQQIETDIPHVFPLNILTVKAVWLSSQPIYKTDELNY